MPEDWSQEEAEAVVTDYFDMLAKELRGDDFNKAEHNRRLQQILVRRTKGSIERKHQNISAILIQLGYPYVNGYKPLGNYQELLREVVEERLTAASAVHEAAQCAVEEPVMHAPSVPDILAILVPPPVREEEPAAIRETARTPRRSVRRNYLEIEARNRSLGLNGEQFVLRYEHERLRRAGQRALAERIEHVAQTQGDHLGYDVLSFEESGRERLIEVKTTRFGSLTPFFASRNEVEVSATRQDDYQLYRLFHFMEQPKLFVLSGALAQTCILEANQFAAIPR